MNSDPVVVDCKFVCLEPRVINGINLLQKRDIPDFHFRTGRDIFVSGESHLGEINVNHILRPLSDTAYLVELVRAMSGHLGSKLMSSLTLKLVSLETDLGYQISIRGEPAFETYQSGVQIAKSSIIQKQTKYEKSLEWLLQQGVSEDELLPLHVVQETTSNHQVTLATRSTFTGLVARCKLTPNEGHLYPGWAKIAVTDEKRNILRRADHYAKLTALHPALRLIKPITHSFYDNEEEGVSALLTFDAHANRELVSLDDQISYFRLRTEILRAYAKENTFENGPAVLYDDELIDVFDVALEHTLMREHRHDHLFQTKPIPFVVEYEKLESWLYSGEACEESIQKMRRQKRLYREVFQRALAYGSEATILANVDRRKSNTFLNEKDLHVYGDDDLIAPGTEEIVLGSMGHQNIERQVHAYVFMRQALELKYGREIQLSKQQLLQRTRDIAFLSSLRFGAYEASRGQRTNLVDLASAYGRHC
ncbi:hypothetical protein HYT55_04525 [Candidatus Woesearchaeota archaeon]|nr:hypothetical protein [Candidatus Woesearchaeota archaeon]